MGSVLKEASTNNNYIFSGLADGTEFEIKVVVKNAAGQTSEKSIEEMTNKALPIEEVLKEGNYVNYVDAKGTTRKCLVLYGPENTNYKENGIQIITMETVEDITIGSTNVASSINSYNNAINTLNSKASLYNNGTYSLLARSVGSVPNNPNYDEAEMFFTDNSYLSGYNGKFKTGDENYLSDWQQMKTLRAYNLNGKSYWLASRNAYERGTPIATSLYVRYVSTSGVLEGNNSGFVNYYTCVYAYAGLRGYSVTRGLRPVFKLKPELKVIGGSGTSEDPYTLGA